MPFHEYKINVHESNEPTMKRLRILYRDRMRHMRKQYCALMRQKQKQQELTDHLHNKMQEHHAEELQRSADRSDYKPIYDFIKGIRKGKTNQKGQPKTCMIHGKDGYKPKSIEAENQIWSKYIHEMQFRDNTTPKMDHITPTQWDDLAKTGNDSAISPGIKKYVITLSCNSSSKKIRYLKSC